MLRSNNDPANVCIAINIATNEEQPTIEHYFCKDSHDTGTGNNSLFRALVKLFFQPAHSRVKHVLDYA